MDEAENQSLDPTFYERADSHIRLSNEQIGAVNAGKVSASMMYATARFNAYVSWTGWDNAAGMASSRKETIDYFVEQYKSMLEQNLDDYINNFDRYLTAPGGTHPDDPQSK
ncbi:MAG TPA: DUF3144 domain-containing protein [Pyrinomonadaceae bacterium]|nr:DUF3144 domain-containing protein [Pyrinomonadaceae bacterium]